MTDDPSGTYRELGRGRGWQGEANRRGTRRHNQAHDAGRRDERQRLKGGGWGLSPGGRRTMPGEDVGSGWYKESGEVTFNSNDGGGGG